MPRWKFTGASTSDRAYAACATYEDAYTCRSVCHRDAEPRRNGERKPASSSSPPPRASSPARGFHATSLDAVAEGVPDQDRALADPARDTGAAMARAGFETQASARLVFRMSRLGPKTPHILGTARLHAADR